MENNILHNLEKKQVLTEWLNYTSKYQYIKMLQLCSHEVWFIHGKTHDIYRKDTKQEHGQEKICYTILQR